MGSKGLVIGRLWVTAEDDFSRTVESVARLD